jgi:hypothetical protein
MAFSAAGENAALSGGLAAVALYASLHSSDPGTTGAGEISPGSGGYARAAVAWGAPASGSMTAPQVSISVPAGTIGWFGLWQSSSGGTFIGGGPLSTSETYGAPGSYGLTPQLQAS